MAVHPELPALAAPWAGRAVSKALPGVVVGMFERLAPAGRLVLRLAPVALVRLAAVRLAMVFEFAACPGIAAAGQCGRRDRRGQQGGCGNGEEGVFHGAVELRLARLPATQGRGPDGHGLRSCL